MDTTSKAHPENAELEAWFALEEPEAVIEPDLPIIDAHHHLWDRRARGAAFPYRTKQYEAPELARDIAEGGHNVVGTVYVQAHSFHWRAGPKAWRPYGELEYCQGVAAKCDSAMYSHGGGSGGGGGGGGAPPRLCWGIQGTVDLRHVDAPAVLRRMAASVRNFRGVRSRGPYDAPFRRGFRALAELGLVFERWHGPPPGAAFDCAELDRLAGLAADFPSVTVVLDHLGGAVGPPQPPPPPPAAAGGAAAATFPGAEGYRGVEDVRAWERALARLAAQPNVVCKVGGIQMVVNGWGLERRAAPVGSDELLELTFPWYAHAIACFGARRCMFESNFPVDRDCVSYRTLWNTFKKLARRLRLTDAEKADIFHDTAKRVYGLRDEPGFLEDDERRSRL